MVITECRRAMSSGKQASAHMGNMADMADMASSDKEREVMDPTAWAREMALAALDKKALDMVVLDLSGLVAFTDCFVICTGTSAPHVAAIVESVEKRLSSLGKKPSGVEGRRAAHWVLLDYGDVVVHVFDPDAREYYELEKLWLDAPRVQVPGE